MGRINHLLLGISLDHIADAAILLDRSLKCVYLNAAACDFLAISQVNALGRPLSELIDRNSELEAAIQQTLETRAHTQRTIELKHRILECVNSPVKGHHGRTEYVMGIWRRASTP